MENIDFSVVRFLWVVMALPIGWLFVMINNLRNDLNAANEKANAAKSKAENAITEQRVREILKEEIGPVSGDIKALTETINKAMREFDEKIYKIALESAKSQSGKSNHG